MVRARCKHGAIGQPLTIRWLPLVSVPAHSPPLCDPSRTSHQHGLCAPPTRRVHQLNCLSGRSCPSWKETARVPNSPKDFTRNSKARPLAEVARHASPLLIVHSLQPNSVLENSIISPTSFRVCYSLLLLAPACLCGLQRPPTLAPE